jgi:hypothetical protein
MGRMLRQRHANPASQASARLPTRHGVLGISQQLGSESLLSNLMEVKD